jgi:hypothetical protein
VFARELPTAMQLVGVPHEMPTSPLAMLRCFIGLATTFHPLPVHRSTSGCVVPSRVTRLPTAKQVVAAPDDAGAHETASRKLCPTFVSFAAGTTDHPVAACAGIAVARASAHAIVPTRRTRPARLDRGPDPDPIVIDSPTTPSPRAE